MWRLELKRVTADGCGDCVPAGPKRRVPKRRAKTEEQPILTKDMELHQVEEGELVWNFFRLYF